MSDSKDRRLYVFKGNDILLGADFGKLPGDAMDRRHYACLGLDCEALRLPPPGQGPGSPAVSRREEGTAKESALAAWVDEALRRGGRFVPFRAAIAELDADEASRAAKGLCLLNWLDVARRCGACGEALVDVSREAGAATSEAEAAGARSCPACGRMFFPRISPAIIVLVRRGERVLLAHNASFPEGRFGLIAGFVEAGESLEEAARRELVEEASVEVGELRYVCSQPWPFPDSLMLAFEADWKSGEGRPDGVEITELRWCGRDDMPSIPPKGSVARRLIDRFLARETEPMPGTV